MSIIIQSEKIEDYPDFLRQARHSLSPPVGFDKTIKAKKMFIRSPLSLACTIDTATDYSVKIDWLQGTIHPQPGKYFDKAINDNKAQNVIDDLFQLLKEILPNQEFDCKPGVWRYGKTFYNKAVSIGGSGKIEIYYNLLEDIPEYSNDRPSICLSFSGQVCSQLEFRQLLGLIAYFQTIGEFRPTRFDIALDDYTRSINYDDIKKAQQSGGVRGFRSDCNIEENISTNLKNTRNGFSFTWGENGDKELQIYDKEAESLGSIPSIRLEARLSREYAVNFVSELMQDFDYDNSMVHLYNLKDENGKDDCELPENFINEKIALMSGVVNGCISFVESGQENKAKSRCKILGWWQNHLENTAKSIKIKSVSRPLTTLPDKLFNNVRCSKSVTKLVRFFDLAMTRIKDNQFTFESFMNLLSCIGSGRLTQADILEVNTWVDIWGSSSEKFDRLLELSGVYQA